MRIAPNQILPMGTGTRGTVTASKLRLPALALDPEVQQSRDIVLPVGPGRFDCGIPSRGIGVGIASLITMLPLTKPGKHAP